MTDADVSQAETTNDAPLLGGDTTQAQDTPANAAPADWTAALDADIRENPAIKGKELSAILKEHVGLQSLIGKKGVIPPGENAKPEDWDKFYNQLGRPESVDKYDLGDFKPPEGLPWNEDAQKTMLAEMHKAGLTNAQAKALVSSYASTQAANFEAMEAAARAQHDTVLSEMKKEYGAAWNEKADLANRAFKATFGDNAKDMASLRLADGTLLGNHSGILKAMIEQGAAMGEAGLLGDKRGGSFTQSPEAAKAELKTFETQNREALVDRSHPEHRAVVARRSQLYQMAFPEQAA